MKNFEKIVPVLASGLVVAGLGTADAFAADITDSATQNTNPAPVADEAKEQNTDAHAPINSATPVGNTETDENGNTTNTIVVNPGSKTDENGTPIIDDTLTSTTTPGTTVPGDPTPSAPVTVTNDDGSTTTTTKITNEDGSVTTTVTTTNPDGSTSTTTTTTKTEESTTTVCGNVATDSTDVSEEEKNKVDQEIKNEDGSYSWDAIQNAIKNDEKYSDVKVEDGENGVHTITFTQKSGQTDAKLNQSELSKVLGKELAAVEGQENTYTYQDGNTTVTVEVTDNSKETTTKTWTVTVTEKTEKKTGSDDVTNKPVVDIKDSENQTTSAKAVLDQVKDGKFDGQEADIATDNAGNITEIKVGNTVYQFTYTTTQEKVEIGNLSNEEIIKLLPADAKYELKDGKIVQTIDGVERELTYDAAQALLTASKVDITMTVITTSEEEHNATDAEKTAANKKAIVDAVTNAVMEAITTDKLTNYEGNVRTQVEADDTDDNSWTVKVTVGDVKYIYTVTMTSKPTSDGGMEWSPEVVSQKDIENLVSGSTTTFTGNAYVSGETVVWMENEGSSVSFIGADGKVSVTEGAQIGENETVSSVTPTKNGAIVVTTYTDKNTNTVTTKTYTFTYNQPLEEKDKDELQEALGNGDKKISNFETLKKTTWTVTETVTGTVEIEDEDVPQAQLPTGVTKDETNDTYSYGDVTLEKDNKLSTSDKKVYTGSTNDGITYTIEETKVPLSEADILEQVKAKYDIPDGVEPEVDMENGTVTYTSGNQTVTIKISNLTQTEIKLTTTIKNQFTSTDSEDDVKGQIASWKEAVKELIADQLKAHGSVVFDGETITSEEEIIQIIERLPDTVTNQSVDFTEMNETDLANLLLKLEQESKDKNQSYMASTGDTYRCNVVLELKNAKYGDTVTINGAKYRVYGNTLYDANNNPYTVGTDGWVTLPVPAGYTNDSFNTKLGHLDLVAEGHFTTEGSSSPQDCVILPSTVEVYLSNDANTLANGNGTLIELQKWFTKDKGESYYQIKRNPINGNLAPENYLDRSYKFYKVTGKVAYGEYKEVAEQEIRNGQPNDNGARKYLEEHPEYTAFVLVNGFYRFYTQTADLTTYGYLGAENNACKNQYDIKLGNLQLLEGKNIVTSYNIVTV